MYWLVVTHLPTYRQDLLFYVQLVQVFIFSVVHKFLSFLIICIFVDAGKERQQWFH